MSLVGPTPCISQEMLKGPPRPWPTGARPLRSGSSSQIAVGKAGCLMVSATVGTLGSGVLDAILYWLVSLVVEIDAGASFVYFRMS